MGPKTTILACACLAACLPCIFAQGTAWLGYVPGESPTVEGDSFLQQPFRFPSSRFQQIYSSSSFSNLAGSQGVYIGTVYFRLDSRPNNVINGYYTNFQINLSTTLRPPEGLSPVFSENVGADDTMVFAPTTVRYFNGSSMTNPQASAIGVRFSQDFFYHPTNGNLLLDIRIPNGTWTAIMDGWNQPGDGISSVFGNFGDSSGTVSTFGLATLFTGTQVPEPSGIALALIGLTAFALFIRKRK
jgi:hypothetical protein